VDLGRNEIGDIAALSSLANLLWLDLNDNPLTQEAYCVNLPNIEHNNPGVDLAYDPNPSPPTGVAASDGAYDDRVEITWDPICNGPSYETYYCVYRSESLEAIRSAVGPWQTETVFEDTTAEPGTTYYYWVRSAVDVTGAASTMYSEPDQGWSS